MGRPILLSPNGMDTVSKTDTLVCVSGPCGAVYYIRIYRRVAGRLVDITRRGEDPPASTADCVRITVQCTAPYDHPENGDEGYGCESVHYDAGDATDIIIGIVTITDDVETQVIAGRVKVGSQAGVIRSGLLPDASNPSGTSCNCGGAAKGSVNYTTIVH